MRHTRLVVMHHTRLVVMHHTRIVVMHHTRIVVIHSPLGETRTLTGILPTCPSSRPLYQFGYQRITRISIRRLTPPVPH